MKSDHVLNLHPTLICCSGGRGGGGSSPDSSDMLKSRQGDRLFSSVRVQMSDVRIEGGLIHCSLTHSWLAVHSQTNTVAANQQQGAVMLIQCLCQLPSLTFAPPC